MGEIGGDVSKVTLENPSAIEKAWAFLKMKPVYISICCLVGLLVIAYLITQIQSCQFQSKLKKAQTEFNAAQANANAVNAQIANLKQQEFETQVDVNAKAANVAAAKREDDEARQTANNALDNLNAVNNRNFNGTSTDDANRARCKAFPDSDGCR